MSILHESVSAPIRVLFLLLTILPVLQAQESCKVQPVEYQGWSAQQLSNSWVKLTFVPQLGGRLMQVEFDGHPYLFVNPKFAGKYIPPEQAAGRWINYGGDKIWPMPEGNEDEQHWVLESSALDDAPYSFQAIEQGAHCVVELDGPADEKTGLQYTRRISIEGDSPVISFHATMRNVTAHKLQWAMQSVSQYNLGSLKNAGEYNKDFWAYTAVNPDSAYLEGFHVRSGLADDPSFHVEDGIFQLHWMYLSNEVWIDSQEGWLLAADGESEYGMMERFDFDPAAGYPGKATVIFYKNGPSVEFDKKGYPELSAHGSQAEPFYMEAEVNSPLIDLKPGAAYTLDTTWFPLRTGAGVKKVTEAGIVLHRLQAAGDHGELKLTGSFAVVVPGRLQLRLFHKNGRESSRIALGEVSPRKQFVLERSIPVDSEISRISLHLIDRSGKDWGLIDEAGIGASEAQLR